MKVSMKKRLTQCVLALSLWCGFAAYAAPANELQTAWEKAEKSAQKGPAKVQIEGQAELSVPKGYIYIKNPDAQNLMTLMGNGHSATLQGLLAPINPDNNTLYTLEFHPEGYVKDDEAKDLNADDILKSYREGTEESNKERVARGFPALEVAGWALKPNYTSDNHRLAWAMIARDKGVTNSDNDGVNYEMRFLGREGYVSMTLLADAKQLTTARVEADKLSQGLVFNQGKRYEDFSASAGDKVAQYGLAALITGAAAKKLGLLAMLGALLVKFSKFLVIGLLFLIKPIKSFLNRRNNQGE